MSNTKILTINLNNDSYDLPYFKTEFISLTLNENDDVIDITPLFSNIKSLAKDFKYIIAMLDCCDDNFFKTLQNFPNTDNIYTLLYLAFKFNIKNIINVCLFKVNNLSIYKKFLQLKSTDDNTTNDDYIKTFFYFYCLKEHIDIKLNFNIDFSPDINIIKSYPPPLLSKIFHIIPNESSYTKVDDNIYQLNNINENIIKLLDIGKIDDSYKIYKYNNIYIVSNKELDVNIEFVDTVENYRKNIDEMWINIDTLKLY